MGNQHHTAKQHSKTSRTKARKHLQRRVQSWNSHQGFLKIPNLWEAAQEPSDDASERMESNVSPKITRSADSFSIVPPIVNACDRGCIVRDLVTITVLVSLALNFYPQRSYHSLTLRRSRIRDSATVTLTPGDGTLKYLRQYWCYRNRSIICNRGIRWTTWNSGDIGLTPASLETNQTNKQTNTTLRRGP